MKVKNKRKIMIVMGCLCVFLIKVFIVNPLIIGIEYLIVKNDYKSNNAMIYKINPFIIMGMNNNSEINRILFVSKLNMHKGIIGMTKNNYNYNIQYGPLCYSNNKKNIYPNIKVGKCHEEIYYYYTGTSQKFVAPYTGTYKFELWGASGGNGYAMAKYWDTAGKGAYVSGTIKLKKNEVLYVYIGSKGDDSKLLEDRDRMTMFYYPSAGGRGGYNGGGDGFDDPQTDAGGGGGGATDIRLIDGNWNNFDSLRSRIIVAAGAGGNSRYWDTKNIESVNGRGSSGSGGTIKGLDALKLFDIDIKDGHGATQTGGYKFGLGQNGTYCKTSLNGLGGGGGGYFGSLSGACGTELFLPPTGAGGGSSYVSGCNGCQSIDDTSTENNIKIRKDPIHYSNKKFENIIMKSGIEKMPSYNGEEMIGNKGDGVAKITYIG